VFPIDCSPPEEIVARSFSEFFPSNEESLMTIMTMFLSVAWVATVAVAYFIAVRLLKKSDLY